MRRLRHAVLAIPVLVAACSEGPFVDFQGVETLPRVAKPIDGVTATGLFNVCYGSRDQFSEAERLARDTCASYGLQTQLVFDQPYQCRVSTPHRARFRCYDPEMTDRFGQYINPFDQQQVLEWQRRTGGKKGPAVPRDAGAVESLRGQAAPPAEPAPPKPAQLTPVPSAPATPRAPAAEDMNPPRPVPPVPSVQPPAPPPPPVPADPGFTLPQGSWGDAFDRQ